MNMNTFHIKYFFGYFDSDSKDYSFFPPSNFLEYRKLEKQIYSSNSSIFRDQLARHHILNLLNLINNFEIPKHYIDKFVCVKKLGNAWFPLVRSPVTNYECKHLYLTNLYLGKYGYVKNPFVASSHIYNAKEFYINGYLDPNKEDYHDNFYAFIEIDKIRCLIDASYHHPLLIPNYSNFYGIFPQEFFGSTFYQVALNFYYCKAEKQLEVKCFKNVYDDTSFDKIESFDTKNIINNGIDLIFDKRTILKPKEEKEVKININSSFNRKEHFCLRSRFARQKIQLLFTEPMKIINHSDNEIDLGKRWIQFVPGHKIKGKTPRAFLENFVSTYCESEYAITHDVLEYNKPKRAKCENIPGADPE